MRKEHEKPGHKQVSAIERQARRSARRRREGVRSVWFGVGMFGLVGWAVAVPVLVGVALGQWLDRVAPQSFSWTLTLLLAGAVLGAINAWIWVDRESRHD